MPKPSVERQRSRIEEIKKQLAEKGGALEGKELRDLKKTLRRAQRKHRRLAIEAERLARPEEKREAKVEEKKEETEEKAAEEPAS